MNKIPNRQAICEVLMKHAETDKDIVVLCSDSRGSASLTPFANAYPEQFVEMGIAEHAPFGGLGTMVSQVVCAECPRKVVPMSLPDAPVITGTSKEVFDYYGLNAEGIAAKAKELLK